MRSNVEFRAGFSQTSGLIGCFLMHLSLKLCTRNHCESGNECYDGGIEVFKAKCLGVDWWILRWPTDVALQEIPPPPTQQVLIGGGMMGRILSSLWYSSFLLISRLLSRSNSQAVIYQSYEYPLKVHRGTELRILSWAYLNCSKYAYAGRSQDRMWPLMTTRWLKLASGSIVFLMRWEHIWSYVYLMLK